MRVFQKSSVTARIMWSSGAVAPRGGLEHASHELDRGDVDPFARGVLAVADRAELRAGDAGLGEDARVGPADVAAHERARGRARPPRPRRAPARPDRRATATRARDPRRGGCSPRSARRRRAPPPSERLDLGSRLAHRLAGDQAALDAQPAECPGRPAAGCRRRSSRRGSSRVRTTRAAGRRARGRGRRCRRARAPAGRWRRRPCSGSAPAASTPRLSSSNQVKPPCSTVTSRSVRSGRIAASGR